jgi:hypothetical protein
MNPFRSALYLVVPPSRSIMMKHALPLFLLLSGSVANAQQWELVAPIKTRSEFPVTQIVYDLAGHTIDLQPDATNA